MPPCFPPARSFNLSSPCNAPAGMGQVPSRMLDLLDLVTSCTPGEPQLGRDAHPEVRRMLQALELDSLLAGGAGVAQGGIRAVSHRGVGLYDVLALKDELLKRYNEWVARHGGASEALKEALRLALQYAQQYNAYVEQLAGQAALLGAWQAVLLVAFTRRWGVGGGRVAVLAWPSGRQHVVCCSVGQHVCRHHSSPPTHSPAARFACSLPWLPCRFDQLAAAAGAGSPVELVLQMAEECLRVLAGVSCLPACLPACSPHL